MLTRNHGNLGHDVVVVCIESRDFEVLVVVRGVEEVRRLGS
jgi:hypothetical protein